MANSNYRLGFTTVTFREKCAAEIVELAKNSGVKYIEWGADVHAKSEDDAKKIRALCDASGVTSISLGSYCRVGDGDLESFLRDCKIAKILGAGRIRVWLGRKGSADVSADEREKMIAETRSRSKIAQAHGLTLAFEFHRKTLTDTGASCAAFLRDVGDENVKTYWQPFFEGNDAENLDAVVENIAAVHVFSWDAECHRFPLADKADEWRAFIEKIKSRREKTDFIIEFVRDDSEKQFEEDVKTLKKLLR